MKIITAKKIFKKFKLDEVKYPKRIYVIYQKSFFKKIQKEYPEWEEIIFSRGKMYLDKKRDIGILTDIGVGYSSAMMVAEELSEAGVKEVIGLGIGAYLNDSEKIKIGDYFLVDEIFSQIDLSNIQKKDKIFSSKKINEEIQKKIKIKKKNIISVISLYEENDKLIKRMEKENIKLIDMELYPMSLILDKNKVKFTQIIFISDIIKNNQWDFKNENFKIAYNSFEIVFKKIFC